MTDATEHAQEMRTPPPPLDGELRFDEVTRKGRADDFGHIVHHMPEGVLLPGSTDGGRMVVAAIELR